MRAATRFGRCPVGIRWIILPPTNSAFPGVRARSAGVARGRVVRGVAVISLSLLVIPQRVYRGYSGPCKSLMKERAADPDQTGARPGAAASDRQRRPGKADRSRRRL